MSRGFQWLLVAGLMAPVGAVQAQGPVPPQAPVVRPRAPVVRPQAPMVRFRLERPLLQQRFRSLPVLRFERHMARREALRRSAMARRLAIGVPGRAMGRFVAPRRMPLLRWRARAHRSMRI